MNADGPREFLDANVLVYAFDRSAGDKKTRAETLVARLWDSGTGCLSVQVLQEFFVIVTRKVPRPLAPETAAERIREFGAWPVFAPSAADVLAAIALQQQLRLSFRDAMIIHSAIEAGCEILWSEDLQDGQTIRGLHVRNPF